MPIRAPIFRRGFTLIELLVVIVIIGLLGVLLVPAVFSSIYEARQNACKQHLHQVALKYLQHADRQEPATASMIPPSPPSQPKPPVNPGCPYCNPPWSPAPKKPADPGAGTVAQETTAPPYNSWAMCPYARRNPAADLDPQNQPSFISYGVFDGYLRGRKNHTRWMMADADVAVVTSASELAFNRHQGEINVAGEDASVRAVTHPDFEWPYP